MASQTSPLISFVVMTYNQQTYVADSIAAALAQTYSPLEIIISDDASSDATLSIINQTVADYAGPHRIILNRNSTNVGIGHHVNKLFAMSCGELIVFSGGDDISAPTRTQDVFFEWEKSGRRSSLILCGGVTIDDHGKCTGQVRQMLAGARRDTAFIISNIYRGRSVALGACAAYTPEVMSAFGALDSTLSIEDTPLAVRASMLGGIGYVDKPLVQYRRNVSVWRPARTAAETLSERRFRLIHLATARLMTFHQILRDVRMIGSQAALIAARRRFIAHRFVIQAYVRGRFPFRRYVCTSLRSKEWINTFALGVLFAYPKVHTVAFRCRKVLKFRSSNGRGT